MPVCQGCGGSFDNNYKFCPYCGRAKPDPEILKIQVSISNQNKFETCRLVYRNWAWRVFGFSDHQVVAEAIGPNGVYLAGESPIYRDYGDGKYNGENYAKQFLINQLTNDGWDPVPSNTGTLFQRLVSENNHKPWQLWMVEMPTKQKRFGYDTFTLLHIRGSKLIQGSSYQDKEEFGSSREWKPRWGDGTIIIKKNTERLNILEEFIHTILVAGFEPVSDTQNEVAKKCLVKDPFDKDEKDAWWRRCFLKHE